MILCFLIMHVCVCVHVCASHWLNRLGNTVKHRLLIIIEMEEICSFFFFLSW